MKLSYLLFSTSLLLTNCVKTERQHYEEVKRAAQRIAVRHSPLGFGFHTEMTAAEAEAHKKRVLGTSATAVTLSASKRKPDEFILDYCNQQLVYVGASFHATTLADYTALRQSLAQRYGKWLQNPDDGPSWFRGPVEIWLMHSSSPEGYRLRISYADVHQGKQYTVESRQKRIEEFDKEIVKEDSIRLELTKKGG